MQTDFLAIYQHSLGPKVLGLTLKQAKRSFYLILALGVVYGLMTEPAFAVTVDSLKEPIKELKKEIFGGWMMAAKIISAAAGLIFSIFRLNLLPFGIGAGISVGIHFIDKWLGEGADGALI